MEKMIKRSSMFVAAAGIATLLSFIIMAAQSGGPLKPADHPNERGFNSAIIWFELLDSRDELFLVLGDPGSDIGRELRQRLDTANRYDFAFMVCYSCFYASLFVLLFALLRDVRMRIDRIVLIAGLSLSLFMLVGDFNENLRLLELSGFGDLTEVREGAITMLRVWTRVKWFSIFIAGLLLAWQYFRYFGARLAGVVFGLLFIIPSLAGSAAFFIPGRGYLLETGSNLLALAWISALGYGVAVYFKTRKES